MTQKRISGSLCVFLLSSVLWSATSQAGLAPQSPRVPGFEAFHLQGRVADQSPAKIGADAAGQTETGLQPASVAGRYIVILSDPPVPSYAGGIANFEAVKSASTASIKLNPQSPAALVYTSHLVTSQSILMDLIRQRISRSPKVIHRLQHALNAVVMVLDSSEADIVARLPGVKRVERDTVEKLDTDYGPSWVGAPGIWEGTATGPLPATEGEGVIVGVLDTGINLDHPSFAATGDDGYTHVNPFGVGIYKGWCDPGNPNYSPAYACNDKLVGAWDYADASWGEADGPEDNDGHGSHTAGTAAGNHLDAGNVTLGPYPYSPPISGVAPHANIIAYDVCGPTSACYSSDSIAALNQAIQDGVDVVNESIGISGDTWSGAKQLAYLAVFDAGITAVRSAGNSGPSAGTVTGSPPWAVTVGASTHNRKGENGATDFTVEDPPTPAGGVGPFYGKGFSAAYGPTLIVYAGDYGDAMCLSPFAAGTFNGEIVVCDRGINARVAKGWNVLQGGAGAMILVNTVADQSLNGDVHHLPAVHLNSDDGSTLKSWLSSATAPRGQISGTTLNLDSGNGDIMAGFSSRGPHPFPNLLAPDLTAPGIDILASYRTGVIDSENPTTEYAFLSGTSMSSPHTAGAAALLKALHPAWSPAEIKSALMATAKFDGLFKEDGLTAADPFDMGSGRVDLTRAGEAGLILDETVANFVAANPAHGGDPRTLNLASMADAFCSGTCSWVRAVKATRAGTWAASYVTPAGMTLEVTPANFTLSDGDTQELLIEADVTGMAQNTYAFGYVVLSETSGGAGSAVHLTAAVRHLVGTPAISLAPAALASVQAPGAVVQKALDIANVGTANLDWSISEAAAEESAVTIWSDDFDGYATGSEVSGQGGWAMWGDEVAAGALASGSAYLSAPNSIEVAGTTDLVREYSGHTTGRWICTARQYIPAAFTGQSYFILLNTYVGSGAGNSWSTQVFFDGTAGQVINTGASGGALALVKDRWVEIRVEIDLTENKQFFYYDGKLLYHGSWTEEVTPGGALNIGALNFYGNAASAVFYDDLIFAAQEVVTEPPIINWLDDFDSYAGGSEIFGQGGWSAWEDNPASGAAVSTSISLSTPNSVDVAGSSDLVHQYSVPGTGRWIYTAWQYIPAAFSGQSYFILLNTYAAGGPYSWSTQVFFDGTAGQVINTGVSGGALALVKDRWVELRVEIDLTENTQFFYYDAKLLYHGSWTDEVTPGGALNIAAVDLYANSSSAVYYDNLSLAESGCCKDSGDVPWLSVDMLSGTTLPGGAKGLNVSIDATGLAPGTYKSTLCVTGNDPAKPLLTVPVVLTVAADFIRLTSTPDKAIPDFNGSTPGQVSDTISVPYSTPISDLNVCLDLLHEMVGDLKITLKHEDTGTTVTLVDRPGIPANPPYGCLSADFDVTVDDEGGDPPIEEQCNAAPPAISGVAPGGDPPDDSLLAAFDGESSQGTWTLTVEDHASGGIGRLSGWCVEIKAQGELSSSVVLKKTVGTVEGVCSDANLINVSSGTTAYYCYTLTNNGSTPVDSHTLVDDKLGTILAGTSHPLSPGSSFHVFASAQIERTTLNTATWTTRGGAGVPVTAAADATVRVIAPPLEKEPTAVPALDAVGTAMLALLVFSAALLILRRRRNR